jgi:hypothetical protein
MMHALEILEPLPLPSVVRGPPRRRRSVRRRIGHSCRPSRWTLHNCRIAAVAVGLAARRMLRPSLTYIDSFILNLTERSCRTFQLLTGRTNVWLAVQLTNLSIVVYFVWAGVYFWSSDVAPRLLVGLFCGGLLYVLAQTIFRVPIEAYENDAYRRVARGFRNPRRVRDAMLRISFLTLSFVLSYPILLVYVNLRVTAVLLTYSLIVLTTVVLYLLACDPLPPCAGKLREWLRGSAAPRLAASKSSRGDLTRISHTHAFALLDHSDWTV